MKSSRQYKKMLLKFMCSDNIKAFEMTVGFLNGWHLHTHEIFFHDSGAFEGEAVATNPAYVTFLKEFEQAYYEIWSKAAFDMPRAGNMAYKSRTAILQLNMWLNGVANPNQSGMLLRN